MNSQKKSGLASGKFLFLTLVWGLIFMCLRSPFIFGASLTASSPTERLEAALEHYQELAKKEAWPTLASGPKIFLNSRDVRVETLRRRLHAEGYLKSFSSSDPLFFDQEVETALKHFQETHGLLVDGTLGKFTVTALNISPSQRICQIQVALERLKSSPVAAVGRHLVVNIPAFSLTLFEGEREIDHYRVIVGQRTKQTPLLTAKVDYLVVNPDWNVPDDIATKEELVKIQKDPNYLSQKKMKILSVGEGNAVEVDPSTVEWGKLQKENFHYRIVQQPGTGNALGTIKFIFPNKYDVYLHDTPDHSLFERADRALSHGCVRLDRPLDLASYLLQEDTHWNREKLEQQIHSGKQRVIPLAEKIPITLIYLTGWVDPDGTIQFRNDLYKHDKGIAKTVCSFK